MTVVVVAFHALLAAVNILFKQGFGAEARLTMLVFVVAFLVALGIQGADRLVAMRGQDGHEDEDRTLAAFSFTGHSMRGAAEELTQRFAEYMSLWVVEAYSEQPPPFGLTRAFATESAPAVLESLLPFVLALVCAFVAMAVVLPAMRFGSTFWDICRAAPLLQRLSVVTDLLFACMLPMIPFVPSAQLFGETSWYRPERWRVLCDCFLLVAMAVRLASMRIHVQSFLIGVVKSARALLRDEHIEMQVVKRHFLIRLSSIPHTAVQFVCLPLIMLALVLQSHSVGQHAIVHANETGTLPALLSVPPGICADLRERLRQYGMHHELPEYRKRLSYDSLYAAGAYGIPGSAIPGMPEDTFQEEDVSLHQVRAHAKPSTAAMHLRCVSVGGLCFPAGC